MFSTALRIENKDIPPSKPYMQPRTRSHLQKFKSVHVFKQKKRCTGKTANEYETIIDNVDGNSNTVYFVLFGETALLELLII